MPVPDRREELRFEADDAFVLPPLIGSVAGGDGAAPSSGPLAEGDVAQQRLDAVYFDTADLRLLASGVTLLRRTGGSGSGWHLTPPAGTAGGSEVRLPAGRVPPGRTPRTVPGGLQAMVRARTLGAPLEPVARITTERVVRHVTDASGQVLVEVTDDRVTGRRLHPHDGPGEAAGALTSWREVGLSLAGGAAGRKKALSEELRGHGLRKAGAGTGLAHVLTVDGGPAADPERPTRKSRAGDVLLAHVRQQVAQVRAQDLPVRLDVPDSVHKMRVATRRLRSALSTFKPLFDPAVVGPLRDELKWLAGELGAARDAEVMRDRVREAVDDRGAGTGAALAELDAAYRAAHDRVLAALDSDRYHRILVTLQELVDRPPLRKPARARATATLPELVAHSYARVRRYVDKAQTVPAGPEQEELWHDARKAAKQSRYAAESVAPVFGSDATAFAAAMEAVQEALGEHQDSVLTRDRLHDLAVNASSTEVAFLYGRLHAQEEARGVQSHEHFAAAWGAAGRKSLHRWLR
ncbi:CHAD domain-containing protein [Blastococcus sp. SYSU D00669]